MLFAMKGISRQLMRHRISPQGKLSINHPQGYVLKKIPDPGGGMSVNFCLYIFMLLSTC